MVKVQKFGEGLDWTRSELTKWTDGPVSTEEPLWGVERGYILENKGYRVRKEQEPNEGGKLFREEDLSGVSSMYPGTYRSFIEIRWKFILSINRSHVLRPKLY